LGAALDAYLGGEDRYEPLVRQLLMIEAWHDACLVPARPALR